MKIVYAGLQKTGYGARAHGESFEYVNIFSALRALPGVHVHEYPFDTLPHMGREKWNDGLLELIRRESPDLFFTFMYTDEFDPNVLDEIRKHTKTLAWFADDYWRFWNYSKRWAPYFSHIVTTAPEAIQWYKNAGIENVLFSQWACNTGLYHPKRAARQDISVSFIGQFKRPRLALLEDLRRAHISIEAFGEGWPNGRVDHAGLLDILSRSQITLNINDRPSRFEPAVLARIGLRMSVDRLVPDLRLGENLRAWWHFGSPHIHARPFEFAGCGAFVISGWANGMEQYYEPDREMVFYKTQKELVEKIRYYLDHENLRKEIAEKGYERTMRDHTYEKRFEEIFSRIGLGKTASSS